MKQEEKGVGCVLVGKDVLKKVRDYKKKTGTPIGFFVEQAILEKLAKCKKTK